ncbi:MAG: hypothetical protein R3321_00310 [Nitrososphaeraceae archaeon]|nr:hypothetical protein [Nitrososphaeraceae archaeon]
MTTNLMLNIFLDGYIMGCEAQHKDINIDELRTHLLRVSNNQTLVVDKILTQYGLM